MWLKSNPNVLYPWWVTGFSDGESSFVVSIFKNKEYKLGYQIQARFYIALHPNDILLLHNLQSFFWGRYYTNK